MSPALRLAPGGLLASSEGDAAGEVMPLAQHPMTRLGEGTVLRGS